MFPCQSAMDQISPILRGMNRDVTIPELLQLFSSHADGVTPTYPPMKPKAGEVFLYFLQDESCKSEHLIIPVFYVI